MPYCGECGKKLSSNAGSCPRCAAPVLGRVYQTNVHQTPPITTWQGNRTILVNQRGHGMTGGTSSSGASKVLTFTFVEGGLTLARAQLNLNTSSNLSFGREGCDVTVAPPSRTVSQRHGTIYTQGGQCFIRDDGSTNGIYLYGARQSLCRVSPGDVLVIGRPAQDQVRTVLLVGTADTRWTTHQLHEAQRLTIGRSSQNDLVLSNPTVSLRHAYMERTKDGGWTITDLKSSNGTRANNRFVSLGDRERLYCGSAIVLGNVQMIFLDTCLLILNERQGVDVSCEGLVRYRKNKGRTIVTTDHVSLHIKRGDFVAIVGGSGSGKSTILNELNGTEPADEGYVLVDGVDLYGNYETLKTSIGYVPQQDIVYDNLTLEDMLASAAKLRMTPDSTLSERSARINEIINLLELDGVRSNFIGRLSGGQKKRASIAVELLADPRLLFLDEPTSGLDPGIERKLMQTLAQMARDGRTIILVTHTTLNLHLCDQVVFLGQGGKLCYAGQPSLAMGFFGVDDLVDIYTKIGEDPKGWQQRFAQSRVKDEGLPSPDAQRANTTRKLPGFMSQFLTLSARYVRLICNDHSRLLLLLAQGPALAAVISLVASEDCFSVYEQGKSCLFALSCAAFWVGVFDSIQEVCKERDIFKREYEGGVGLAAYTASKAAVLGGLCLLQSLLLCGVFLLVTNAVGKAGGSLGSGCIIPSGALEMIISVTLLTLSAMFLGLLVSALFDNPDRAIALAPLLIMPQILFAGVVFKLDDGSLAQRVSYAVNCRWGMEALGTTFNLDHKDLAMYGQQITIPEQDKELHDLKVKVPASTIDTAYGPMEIDAHTETIDSYVAHIDKQTKTIDSQMLEHDPQDLDGGMFLHTPRHLLHAWLALAGMCIACATACLFALRVSLLH